MNRPNLERLQQLARRDDWHLELVGSDVREIIAYALALESRPKAETDVLAERAKQNAKWGDDHDDEQTNGAIGAAGALLAWPDGYWFYDKSDADKCCIPAPGFAYDTLRKHVHDRRRQLVIAAALLLAEIERLDRADGE